MYEVEDIVVDPSKTFIQDITIRLVTDDIQKKINPTNPSVFLRVKQNSNK